MCHLANSLFVGKSSHTGRDILFTEVNNMDQIKTGKFIAYLRKQHNLTQEALGEKLGVTNKTVSRWENANYMPDIEMLQLLSKELNVSVNELLAGEFLSDEEFRKRRMKMSSLFPNRARFPSRKEKLISKRNGAKNIQRCLFCLGFF